MGGAVLLSQTSSEIRALRAGDKSSSVTADTLRARA
jgi:hypothetical protein